MQNTRLILEKRDRNESMGPESDGGDHHRQACRVAVTPHYSRQNLNSDQLLGNVDQLNMLALPQRPAPERHNAEIYAQGNYSLVAKQNVP